MLKFFKFTLALLLFCGACDDEVNNENNTNNVNNTNNANNANNTNNTNNINNINNTNNTDVVEKHCTAESCSRLNIVGDELATFQGGPAPFLGYADPSMQLDAENGDIWLSYTWCSYVENTDGSFNFGVNIHLARSQDGGDSFNFVKEVNSMELDNQRWLKHEVSNLTTDGTDWEVIWLAYYEDTGVHGSYDGLYFSRSVSEEPENLGENTIPHMSWIATDPEIEAEVDLSSIPELSHCAAMTEPALFHHNEQAYLLANCIVIDFDTMQPVPEEDQSALLKRTATGYKYLGALLDGEDYEYFGVEKFSQEDISLSVDGKILFNASRVMPGHIYDGCLFFEIEDLEEAKLRRDSNGHPVVLARITAEGSDIHGEGQCTYNRNSSTGIIITTTQATEIQEEPYFKIEFIPLVTNIHL